MSSWRRGGRIAVVRFDDAPVPLEVPAAELTASEPERPHATVIAPRLLSAPAPAPTTGPARTAAPAPAPLPMTRSGPALVGTYESRLASLTLEAMRLGVVPATDLSAYTVGRDVEVALVDADLREADERGGSVRAFLGDYGVGKTHLLELCQERALAQGFLTARATLDPLETSPSHPKRVYRALVRSLRYPDRPAEEGAGLGPLLGRAAESPAALALLGLEPRSKGASLDAQLSDGLHLYLSAAVAYTRSLQRAKGHSAAFIDRCADLLGDWIEGHPTISNQAIDADLSHLRGWHPKVYSLLDYRPWSRIYGYLLSGLSALARASGYRGLCLVLDEAEFYNLLSRENRAYASHLFKSWTLAALGGTAAGKGAAPLEELPFDAKEIDIGGYGVQQRLPGRYGTHPGLYVVFAMTPSPDGVAALGGAVPASRVHTLAPFESRSYLALAGRVCDFYVSARPDWSLPGKIVEPLGKVLAGLLGAGFVTNPRQAMKVIIEFLDIVRLYPTEVPGVIRALQAQLTW